MTQQQEQIYGPYVGTIGQTEEQTPAGKASYYRIELLAADGSSQWFSAFGNTPKIMLSQPGAMWSCTYTVWTGTNGNQRYTIKDAQTATNGSAPVQAPPVQQAPIQQAPIQQAPVQHMPVDQTVPPQAHPVVPDWSLNLTDKDRCIIRQVAFKDVQDKDSKSYDEIDEKTDHYEAIILGIYEPGVDTPSGDGFIQHEI